MRKSKNQKSWMYFFIGTIVLVILVVLWYIRSIKKPVGKVTIDSGLIQKDTNSGTNDLADSIDGLKAVLIKKGTTTNPCGCS